MSLFRKKKTDEADQSPDEHTVDVRAPVPGQPEPCPECGGPGYLDHIDLVTRRQLQHCKRCGHEWEISLAPAEEPSFFELEGGGIELPPRP